MDRQPQPQVNQVVLPSLGPELARCGALVIATSERPTGLVGMVKAEGLPARHRLLCKMPGDERLISATVHIGRLAPPGEGWAVLDLPAFGLHFSLKLES